jgi:hypothetical protein
MTPAMKGEADVVHYPRQVNHLYSIFLRDAISKPWRV